MEISLHTPRVKLYIHVYIYIDSYYTYLFVKTINLSVCLSIFLASIRSYIHRSIDSSVYLFVCQQSIDLSIYLKSIYLASERAS